MQLDETTALMAFSPDRIDCSLSYDRGNVQFVQQRERDFSQQQLKAFEAVLSSKNKKRIYIYIYVTVYQARGRAVRLSTGSKGCCLL
jgi:hypothetical protein